MQGTMLRPKATAAAATVAEWHLRRLPQRLTITTSNANTATAPSSQPGGPPPAATCGGCPAPALAQSGWAVRPPRPANPAQVAAGRTAPQVVHRRWAPWPARWRGACGRAGEQPG